MLYHPVSFAPGVVNPSASGGIQITGMPGLALDFSLDPAIELIEQLQLRMAAIELDQARLDGM